MARLQKAWEERVRGVVWNVRAAQDIIGFLFNLPRDVEPFRRWTFSNKWSKPQGISVASPRDYLQRMLSEELSESEVRDQYVLQVSLVDIKGIATGELPKCLANADEFSEIWEHLLPAVHSDYLLDLAGRVISLLIKRDDENAEMPDGGLVAIWRRLIQNRPTSERLVEWLTSQAQLALHNSLRLANDLFYYFANEEKFRLSSSQREMIRNSMVETVRRMCVSDGDGLIASILPTSGFAWTIQHFVFPPDEVSADPTIVHAEFQRDWSWLGCALIQALNAFPTRVYPSIVVVVVEGIEGQKGNPKFRKNVLTGVFAENSQRLLDWFVQNAESMPDVERVSGRQIADMARDWITKA